ncbi:hypothetical protein HID58_057809, partial [Brassica napus]
MEELTGKVTGISVHLSRRDHKDIDDAKERLRIVLVIRNSETAMNQVKPVISSCSDRMLMQIEPDLMQEYWLRYGGSTSSHGTEAVTQRAAHGYQVAPVAVPPRQGNEKRRRRTNGVVPALRSGNTDLPPDDNHTWRKYGQKEILHSKFPRAYYRCTHQKLYNCPAKKQVQRLNDDPFTFRVTYRGSHTCHIYSTAPTASAAAPTAPITTTATTSHPVDYGPFFDMAEAMMLGSGGIGDNMDSYFLGNDPLIIITVTGGKKTETETNRIPETGRRRHIYMIHILSTEKD